MKVKELIKKLQALDPEMPVLVDGFEAGADKLDEVLVEQFSRGIAHPDLDCYGEFSKLSGSRAGLGPKPAPGAEPFTAVLLPRKSN